MPKIICDIDGVILDLHTEIEQEIRKKYPEYRQDILLTYDLNKTLPSNLSEDDKEHYKISDELRQDIISCFSNKKIFERCEIDIEVVKEIKHLLDNDFSIIFHSMSYSVDIAKVKYDKLSKALEGYAFEYLPIIKDSGITKGICQLKGKYKIDDNLADLKPYLMENERGCMLVQKSYNNLAYNEEYVKWEKNKQLEIYSNTLNVFLGIAKNI